MKTEKTAVEQLAQIKLNKIKTWRYFWSELGRFAIAMSCIALGGTVVFGTLRLIDMVVDDHQKIKQQEVEIRQLTQMTYSAEAWATSAVDITKAVFKSTSEGLCNVSNSITILSNNLAKRIDEIKNPPQEIKPPDARPYFLLPTNDIIMWTNCFYNTATNSTLEIIPHGYTKPKQMKH